MTKSLNKNFRFLLKGLDNLFLVTVCSLPTVFILSVFFFFISRTIGIQRILFYSHIAEIIDFILQNQT